MRKNCSTDRGKLLKFEAEGQEFAKFLRSLEQFFQAVFQRSEQFLVKDFFYYYYSISNIFRLIYDNRSGYYKRMLF